MPRVLLASFSVCPAPDRHGAQLTNVIKALAPRFELDVVTLRVGDLPYVDRYLGARMLRVPVGTGDLLSQAQAYGRALGRQLEGEEYELIHLRSAWGASQVLARTPATTRILYDVARSLEGEPDAADERARQALSVEEAACLERAQLVLVPTEHARRHLYHRGHTRATVLPLGVDVDQFDWEPAFDHAPAWLGPRRVRGKRSRPARILYAGRLNAGGGIRLMVRAVGMLRQAYDVRLVLAGPVAPEFETALDEALGAAKLHDAVDLLGPIRQSDVPRVIAQSTICVAPFAPDLEARPLAGCPIKVLEYLACRRPVVAPRRPAITEVVRDGRDGLLFEPEDATDLARQLARLLEERDLRNSLAESGYRRVRSRFPASAVRRALLEAYARLEPPSRWIAPTRVAPPIGAMPVRLDSTTARFQRFDLSDAFIKAETQTEIDVNDLEPVEESPSDPTPRPARSDTSGAHTQPIPMLVVDESEGAAVGPLLPGARRSTRKDRPRSDDETPT